ncbi:MAG: c-type cytochrome [Roseicyclus sp.]
MRRFVVLVVVLAALGLGAFFALTVPERADPAELAELTGDVARGETVFWAAGCASCHAAEDAAGEERLVLSGGRRLVSDFGTFVAPNVSTDPDHGIGDWTLEEFVTAVAHGTSPEGAHYYPSFPYPSYRLAETQDLVDLWAFWQSLPASDRPSEPHELAFPVTIRRGVGLWNLANLPDDFVLTGDLSPEVARGRRRCCHRRLRQRVPVQPGGDIAVKVALGDRGCARREQEQGQHR